MQRIDTLQNIPHPQKKDMKIIINALFTEDQDEAERKALYTVAIEKALSDLLNGRRRRLTNVEDYSFFKMFIESFRKRIRETLGKSKKDRQIIRIADGIILKAATESYQARKIIPKLLRCLPLGLEEADHYYRHYCPVDVVDAI